MVLWLYILTIQKILNVYISNIVVIDAHTKEICNIFWDENKKMILSGSHDKSVKLYQVPIMWPSEMIQKSKSKTTLIREDDNRDDNFIPITSTDEQPVNEERFREITEHEIYSDDLNGWDNE
jgi:hypothetical protein